ncbi:MAG TPA: geranylgeranylglycerol-phosphate geranylgeranyltransferase [Chitinophagaceae bacterium]|jgi:4-hydroxybenzoate polyprenyltransferase|nr:geranylgeranylglycerol-phosphate geranylgeranyltransferase [Chitinophagaceae bacterium]
MNLVGAFIKMIRLPNLIFIVLTQVLFHVSVLDTILLPVGIRPAIDGWNFVLLSVSSVLIAAAGYIINDYFDINIDQINKPRANVVDKIVSRRWAMAWHFVLSGLGIILSGWLAWRTGLWYILIGNFICVLLLFAYSVSLKRKLLVGNVVISLLTAWVILVISFSELIIVTANNSALIEAINKIERIGFLYASFAFISSLIREAIKDIEDLQGDEKYGCRTMPIVWGVNAAKVYIAVWLVVILALLVILQVYVARFEWWWAMAYSIVFIIGPFVLIFLRLYKAKDQKDYHRLSNWTKLVMLTGILSMVFFYFYL